MKRRLLAIFLSLTLMLSLIPSAWAVENGGDATPYNTSEEEPQNGLTGYCGDPAVNDGKNVTWEL